MKDPTHILCIRITDQQVIDYVKKLQHNVYVNSPFQKHDLIKAMSDIYSLNLLLGTMRIRSAEQLRRVKETLSLYHQEVIKMMDETLYLNFNGLGLVGDTELYMHVQNDQHTKTLKRIAGYLIQLLIDIGVEVHPRKTFIAHLTVFKYSAEQRERGLMMSDYQWTDFKYDSFGRQKVESIQLCDLRVKPRFCYFKIDWERNLIIPKKRAHLV